MVRVWLHQTGGRLRHEKSGAENQDEKDTKMKTPTRNSRLLIIATVLLPALLMGGAPAMAKGDGQGHPDNGHSKLSPAAQLLADSGGPEMVDVIVQ